MALVASRGADQDFDIGETRHAVRPVGFRPAPRRSVAADHEAALPDDLARFGSAVRARVTGDPAGPLIVVLGGISGNRNVCPDGADVPGWWPGFVGRGCAVDPARHCVVGVDFAADPEGRAAPSTADQARVLGTVLDHLGRARADAIVGASYGGMVALAFAQAHPERVGKVVVISAAADPHPAATANRALQRRVVALGIKAGDADAALAIARGMAMLTYRTADEFAERFDGGIAGECPLSASAPGDYLAARGACFRSVMSPERFLSLSASIDRHRVDPGRITTPTLLIGATSDLLVPPAQMEALAAALAGPAALHLVDCLYGHDMFLKEAGKVGALAAPFLAA